MDVRRQRVRDFEARWRTPVALITFLGTALLIVSAIVISKVHGSGEAEVLRSAHEHHSAISLASTLEALGLVLMVAPLYFLFRATLARTPKLRRQLIGLVIVAPIFLAGSSLLKATATTEAADSFVAGEAKVTLSQKKAGEECTEQAKDKGAEKFGEEFEASAGESAQDDCTKTKVEDSTAEEALSEASANGPGNATTLVGRLGLAIALGYTCLWAMRVGLLTRLWGSLGIALGIASLLLLQFSLIFFIYFGLLLLGFVPGGRPPAWELAKAVPWPTPGQKIAAEIDPRGDGPEGGGDGDGDGPGPAIDAGEADQPGGGGARRKRKRRR